MPWGEILQHGEVDIWLETETSASAFLHRLVLPVKGEPGYGEYARTWSTVEDCYIPGCKAVELGCAIRSGFPQDRLDVICQ